MDGQQMLVVKEPVGPVAAFTPWNFPINQAVRKLSGAVAAGCSIILKGPDETPASCAALVKCFVDAGLPEGVVNLVYGIPAEISEYLIPHPVIRKVTFTGSTAVGKQLAAMAGEHMKRVTMELGGHSPAIVFEDADVETALQVLTDVPLDARIMNEEPFGPVAPITPFKDYDAVVEEANRLDYGLCAYAYTNSAKTAAQIGADFESGMVSINHHGIGLIESPFGGVKDSGYGHEGGSEAIEAYLNTKYITQVGL